MQLTSLVDILDIVVANDIQLLVRVLNLAALETDTSRSREPI